MSNRPPWWLLPNLLSLDAPLVAVVWMWVLAKSMRVVYVESYAYWLVAAAVWSIYVLDRLLDMYRYQRNPNSGVVISKRHEYHWKYRKVLIPVVTAVVVYSIYAAFNIASEALLSAGVSGIALVAVYLLVSKVEKGEVRYFKNFVAGMTFAYGVAAPIIIESTHLEFSLSGVYYHLMAAEVPMWVAIKYALNNYVVMVVEILSKVFITQSFLPFLFGLLCFLNITAIDLWEKSRHSDDEEEKAACEATLGMGLLMLMFLTVYYTAFKATEIERIFCYAVMVSTALLQILNRKRSFFYLDAQRVLVDFIMIVPLPLVYLLT